MLNKIRFFLKQQRGAAMLVNMVIVGLMMGLMATSFAQLSSAQFSNLTAYRTGLQAYQLVEAKANEIGVTSYSSLAAEPRAAVTGATQWQREVLLGAETDLGGGNMQRPVTINVYKDAETVARASVVKYPTSAGTPSSGVPIGTVIIWPSNTSPSSGTWLLCNGQSTAGYPALAAIVGSNVPDYQGVFLRGYGSQSSNHYGAVLHSSGALGVLQGDAIRNIWGGINGGGVEEGGGGVGAVYITSLYSGAGGGWSDYGWYFDSSRVVPVANENRPVNKAVYYLIKAQ